MTDDRLYAGALSAFEEKQFRKWKILVDKLAVKK
jgi:hypothetical protein